MKRLLPTLAAVALAAPLLAQAQMAFDDIDSDGNGSLSLEEAQAVGVTAEQFNQFDSDGNGEWSEEEYSAATGGSGEKSTTPEY